MGDWSTTYRRFSRVGSFSFFRGATMPDFLLRVWKPGTRPSMMRLLFPLPETPVTTVRQPSGIDASTPFRLLAWAPSMRMASRP